MCSPSRGDRSTSAGLSDSLTGQPTERYSPLSGWPTRTIVPVANRPWSPASSLMERIGPTGMSSGLHVSITSRFVFVTVHSSIRPKISSSLPRRSGSVA